MAAYFFTHTRSIIRDKKHIAHCGEAGYDMSILNIVEVGSMADVKVLETKLNEVFGEKAPALPEGGKKFLVDIAPWLTLLGAIGSVLGAWALWQAAHYVSNYANFANELSRAYGDGTTVSTSQMTLFVWLGVGLMLVNAALYFMAFNPLKAHQKKGWDLLFYVMLLNVAYSVVSIFIDSRGFGSFLMSLVGTAIGTWLLFQVRPAYLAKKSEESPKTPAAPAK